MSYVQLAEQLTEATSRLRALQEEVDQLAPAAAYMQQLLDTIEHHNLHEEWQTFLRRAELSDWQ